MSIYRLLMRILNHKGWIGMLLILLTSTSCQLVGEQHSPVEGLWFKRESNSLYDIEETFFADGTFESIGFLRDPDTDERLEIAFAEIGTYHLAGDRIQFRVGLETAPRVLEPFFPLPLPLDSLKSIRNYMARPRAQQQRGDSDIRCLGINWCSTLSVHLMPIAPGLRHIPESENQLSGCGNLTYP